MSTYVCKCMCESLADQIPNHVENCTMTGHFPALHVTLTSCFYSAVLVKSELYVPM